MKYAGLIKNDFSAAPGVSVTFYTQGCPHHCLGCQNPETWDFDGGKEFTTEVLEEILMALNENGIERSLAIQGGEPLCPDNLFLTYLIIKTVKDKSPNTKIYVWTGYTKEEFETFTNPKANENLKLIDCLIDGPYIAAERHIPLPRRGSKNQRIFYFDKN